MHEHAVVQVVSGRLGLTLAGRDVECDAGMLMTFRPGETRSVRALEPSRLLLLLMPWPGAGHLPGHGERGSRADAGERLGPAARELTTRR